MSIRAEGEIRLDTGVPITHTSLLSLTSGGATSVAVRTSYSCISLGGICQKCLAASRPKLGVVTLGSNITLKPELQVDIVLLTSGAGATTITLPYSTTEYDVLYIYNNGVLVGTSAYSISGNVLSWTSPFGSNTDLVCKFYVNSNIGYYYWLSKTYSGSLLGLKPLLQIPPPVKYSLLINLINNADIDVISQALNTSSISDQDTVLYIPSIKDPLEKAIFVITLASVFLN